MKSQKITIGYNSKQIHIIIIQLLIDYKKMNTTIDLGIS